MLERSVGGEGKGSVERRRLLKTVATLALLNAVYHSRTIQFGPRSYHLPLRVRLNILNLNSIPTDAPALPTSVPEVPGSDTGRIP